MFRHPVSCTDASCNRTMQMEVNQGMPGPAAASFAIFGLLIYIYWRKMVRCNGLLIIWSLRIVYPVVFLDTRHIKHGSDKKKVRHILLRCQLIHAHNLKLNILFFGKGKCLVWQSLQSEHRLSFWTHDDMTNAWRSISLLTMKDLVLKRFKIVIYKFLSFVYFWSKWFLITAMLPIVIRDNWDTCTLDRRVAQESDWHVAE